jgi:hypothetical protein
LQLVHDRCHFLIVDVTGTSRVLLLLFVVIIIVVVIELPRRPIVVVVVVHTQGRQELVDALLSGANPLPGRRQIVVQIPPERVAGAPRRRAGGHDPLEHPLPGLFAHLEHFPRYPVIEGRGRADGPPGIVC